MLLLLATACSEDPDTGTNPDAGDTSDASDTDDAQDTDTPDAEDTDTPDAEDTDTPDAEDTDTPDTNDPDPALTCDTLECAPLERCLPPEDPTYDATCRPLRVLTLEEGPDDAFAQISGAVADALEDRGVEVIRGPRYTEWQAESETLLNVDTVVWFQGHDYAADLDPDARAILRSHVLASGVGLVRTEWAAYARFEDDLLPVSAESSNFDWDYGTTWQRSIDSPVGASLPETFEMPVAGFSLVEPLGDAIVLWQNPQGVPLVTWDHFENGKIIHINHDVSYSLVSAEPAELSAEAVEIFVDASIFVARP